MTEAPLLYSRQEAGRMLGGISVASLRRLEAAKKLTAVKLSGKRAGQTFYRASQVHALAAAPVETEAASSRKRGRA